MRTLTGKTLKGFYAIEGIDGAGKTTLFNALKEKCRKEGKDGVLMFHAEPTDSDVGRACRRMIADGWGSVPPSFAAYMFAADRYNHLYDKQNGILALLEQGKMVLTDRYLYSSIVYQTCMEDDRESLHERRLLAARINSGFEMPEKVFFLKCKPALALERQKKRGEEHVDTLDRLIMLDQFYKITFEREETMYKWVQQDYPLDHVDLPIVVRLDASKDIDELVSLMYLAIFS